MTAPVYPVFSIIFPPPLAVYTSDIGYTNVSSLDGGMATWEQAAWKQAAWKQAS
jgi:hypothetical protein